MTPPTPRPRHPNSTLRRLRAKSAAVLAQMVAVSGVETLSRRERALTGGVLAVALAAVVGGPLLPVPSAATGGLPLAARFGVVVGLSALAQLAWLRVRLGSETVAVAWGEAPLIIGLHLLPAAWLPAAAFVGVSLAMLVRTLTVERRTPVRAVHSAASLTLGTVAAAALVEAVADPYGAPPTPGLAAALVLGALAYLMVTLGLVAVTLWVRAGAPARPTLARVSHGKLPMFVGNVLVGLVAVAMLRSDPRWLVLLPPGMWLLQQMYVHRLRVDEERQAWQVFAGATRALDQLDERGVAAAGVRGALQFFAAEEAEVVVLRPNGERRRYAGQLVGSIVEGDAPALPAVDDRVATRALAAGGTTVGELRVRLREPVGERPRNESALSAFGDALGTALHDAATRREMQIMAARSSHASVHDALTGLLNRGTLLACGDAALQMLDREHAVALLLLDLNEFRDINDTLGHPAGDELLKVTAERLRALTRPGELLARLGGDEFGLLITSLPLAGETTPLLAHPAALPQVLRRARQITEHVAAPTEVAGVELSVEASVGVVVSAAGSADMTELLRRVDIALYQAKEGGGIAWYDSAKDDASTDQLTLLAELREALNADDQLVLALQPAVDLATGAATGVEALIRWRHPRRGRLLPVDFVRAVEGSELLAPFTRYVVDRALSAAAQWTGEGLDVPVAVNLSARNLLDPHLPADVAELLRRHRVPAQQLVLEITETVVMSELEIVDEVLAALRAQGVRLSVDDFGTGYSSLMFLTRISVDELKVDRAFVAKMDDSPQAAAVVRAVVELGRELGLRVVAEGVETTDQRAALTDLGCTAAQGFHFFKPMPADKIVAVLRSLHSTAVDNVLPLRADGAC